MNFSAHLFLRLAVELDHQDQLRYATQQLQAVRDQAEQQAEEAFPTQQAAETRHEPDGQP